MQTLLRDVMEDGMKDNQEEQQGRPIRDYINKEEILGSDSLNSNETKTNEEIRTILEQSLPKIQVIGIGGMGCNASLRLKGLGLSGIEIIAINTDAQDLLDTNADRKLLIGSKRTRGFGAGNNPTVGEAAAQESIDQIKQLIDGDLVFVTCGLGGGTGTGAAPLIAKAAKDKGVLTISICTMPFIMEGPTRLKNAQEGLKRIYQNSDTVIIVPNERLLSLAPDIELLTAFKIADEVLIRAVSAITELITEPQLINLDFADVKKILDKGGIALIGYGESSGSENKVEEAVDEALRNPLLKDMDISTARKALICVSGGNSLGLKQADMAVNMIAREIERDAEIIWGAAVQPKLNGTVRVIAILSDVRSPILESDEGIFFQDDIDQILMDFDNNNFNPNNIRSKKSFSYGNKKINENQSVSKEPEDDNKKGGLRRIFKIL